MVQYGIQKGGSDVKQHWTAIYLLASFFLAGGVQAVLLSRWVSELGTLWLIYIALSSGLVCAVLVCIGRLLQTRRDNRLIHLIQNQYNEESIDLAAEFPPEAFSPQRWLAAPLNNLTYNLNSMFLKIIGAIKKFSLFSSDIYFSSRQLSEQSIQQATKMRAMQLKAANFQNNLTNLSGEIEDLLQELNTSSSLYSELDRINTLAQRQLKPLVDNLEDVRTRAMSGREKMDTSLVSLEELTTLIIELDKKIDKMNAETQQIGEVLGGVQDIVERTHILATNASIEAARAGTAGDGFRVIANEVRNLAGGSRKAIQEVERFLTANAGETRKGAVLSQNCARKAAELKQFSDESALAFREIHDGVEDISEHLTEYAEIFQHQRSVLTDVLQASTSIHGGAERVGSEVHTQVNGYSQILSDVEKAVQGAEAASNTAQVLSQLGSYIKIGSKLLTHIVETCKISEVRHLRRLKRREKRRSMLYNLEVLQDSYLIGHLGDISSSGMLIYSENEHAIGKSLFVQIRMPLSKDSMDDVDMRITPRRCEPESSYFKVGCSIDSTDSTTLDSINEIIANYTVDKGMDLAIHAESEVETSDVPVEELEEL